MLVITRIRLAAFWTAGLAEIAQPEAKNVRARAAALKRNLWDARRTDSFGMWSIMKTIENDCQTHVLVTYRATARGSLVRGKTSSLSRAIPARYRIGVMFRGRSVLAD